MAAWAPRWSRVSGRSPAWAALAVLACGTQDRLSLGAVTLDAGSGGPGTESGAGDRDAGSAEAGDEGGLVFPPCVGLQCSVNRSCPMGGHTTVTGKVFDPAGQNPLYSVLVFVPSDPTGTLPPITPGTTTCNTCDASIGRYVAATTTDATGSFTLRDVPTGAHVPLVVQTGKWRRKQFIQTADCAETAVPQSMTRLPRNRSEGDMPQMALLTGGCDDLGCFMRSVGIDASEFSNPHGGGRLDIYKGLNGPSLSGGDAGNCTGAGCGLWSTRQDLEYYDMVLLACECDENLQSKPAAALTAMHDWLDEGGKVFATHYHYTWFQNGGLDFQGVATWLGTSFALGSGTYALDTSFPKGQVLHDWLANLGGLSGGGIALNSVAASASTVHAPAVRWIYDPSTSAGDAKYLSFLTPVGGVPGPADAGADGGSDGGDPHYCGKAVFTDLHTSGAPSGDVPAACSPGTLTAQQKALEFLFFDLSACVAPDTMTPPLPPPSPP
jgi:hypothetical protein